MNIEWSDTQLAILATARELFARRGYDGTSIRAISSQAGVNLGAITYHFGSKASLYTEVIRSVVEPLRDRVVGIADGPGAATGKLTEIVAAYFDHFAHTPEMPKLVIQQVFTGQPLSPALRDAMASILGALIGVLRAGQAAGSIRGGRPEWMALSLLSQPIYFNIIRGPLTQAGLLDLGDPRAYRAVVEHVTQFALAGLTQHPGVAE